LALFERSRSSNPSQTAELLNTLGLVQMNLGQLSEAHHYFERALKIYSHIAPLGQSEKTKVEKNLQCALELQQNTDNLQFSS
jgi:Tfp pilus assembly protein PilF